MRIASLLALLLVSPAVCADPYAYPAAWATYRGSHTRTGNTDGVAGPAQPAVLWAMKSQDHFIASPVPVGDKLFVSGLGGFNRPTISLFPLTAKGMAKPAWTKSAPYLKLASVSSPAVVGNALVFGDGMHQDSGGMLHCVTADTGKPLWQLVMPGNLVHLEGAPTVWGGKVFMGGGAAGVFCLEHGKAVLDGKELDLATIATMQDAKWKELQAKFEKDKKADPDLALEPSDDQLHKPAPKMLWQKGKDKWHVDAPVNVHSGMVLVPSSYLDKEKVGERALICLQASTGETLWTAPLTLNPWGGASVADGVVIVPGSSIGYYYNELRGAKGDITALFSGTGKQVWRKEIPGGVVGAVAIADGLAVCTATDGKVRAFKLADGERAWLYDTKTPTFAPPAVVAGVAYVADLLGTVHAIDMKTGTPRWTLSIAKEVGSPGMVYGGVTVHGGKLFVATCNLEGPSARKETVVVCIGSK
ncbi:MAG TPA: PQQ-binding-like beta-propeller repeat protein [Gemmataceae bacterium]|nr:PQQ-binding-like beta-propeller repeat protein [Gemmataceae bacterium]